MTITLYTTEMNESMSSEEEVLTDVSCEISNYDNNGEVLSHKPSSLEDQSKGDQHKQEGQPKKDQPNEDQPKEDQPKVDQPKEDQPKEDQSKDQSKGDQSKEEWLDIIGNGQLMKKIIKKGTKDVKPIQKDVCTLTFTGVLDDGIVVEDQDNVSIQLGDFEVVQGLDLTIVLMELGEIAEIKIDPRFAYGTRGEGSIPPNATITYTVELKAIEDSPDIESLSVKERRELGNKKRQRGNWWFVRKELNFAIQCYQRASEYLQIDGMNWNEENEESGPITDSQLQGLLDDCIKVYNNLAAALIEMGSYNTALENIERVLKYQPKNLKALFRKGRILKAKGNYGKAYMAFLEVQKIDPDVKSLQTELMTLKEIILKQTEKEKHLYAKMLGINKETDKSSKNIKVEEKSKLAKGILWTAIGASAAVIGILVHRFVS
ncbi:PREDICTED: peptidyl-prolyl cis-trans isomerase FKBP8-like isoform X2 [Trachymyrmex cornetzi]|uniref:peptidyl-prolyl cis-trans isomerase FKBP8-like isoform X2 n=1 Tax=Trachymyrmex cornetzi TaxID=471704 RepID=UPI00084F1287|nr:PREDICTED: peptidyl-prolyl cis-trans isomerase FKBP8-like isoform X2 [Trachymyrmex cornetzi]